MGKFLSMKNKFSNVMNSFKGMFGGQEKDSKRGIIRVLDSIYFEKI